MNKLTEQNLLKKSRFLKYSLLASISVGAIIAIPFEGMASSNQKALFRDALEKKLSLRPEPERNTYTSSEIREMEISKQSKAFNPLKDIPIEDHYKKVARSKSDVGKARKVRPPTRSKTFVGAEKVEQNQNNYTPEPTEQTPQKPEIIITASSPTVSPASNGFVTVPNTPNTTLTSPEHYTTAPGTPSTPATPYQPTPDSKPNDNLGAKTPPNTNSKAVRRLSFSSEPQQTVQPSTQAKPPVPPKPLLLSSAGVAAKMVSNILRVNEMLGVKLAEVESTIKNTQDKKNKKPLQQLKKQIASSQKTTEELKSEAAKIGIKIKELDEENKSLASWNKKTGGNKRELDKDNAKLKENNEKIDELQQKLTNKNNEANRLSEEIDILVGGIVLTKPQRKALVTEMPPAGSFLNQQQQLEVLTRQQKFNAARQAAVDKKRAEANEVKRNSADAEKLKQAEDKQRTEREKKRKEENHQKEKARDIVRIREDIAKKMQQISNANTTSNRLQELELKVGAIEDKKQRQEAQKQLSKIKKQEKAIKAAAADEAQKILNDAKKEASRTKLKKLQEQMENHVAIVTNDKVEENIKKLEGLALTPSTTSSAATISKQSLTAKSTMQLSHELQRTLPEDEDGYLEPIKVQQQPHTVMLSNQEVADPKSMDSGFKSLEGQNLSSAYDFQLSASWDAAYNQRMNTKAENVPQETLTEESTYSVSSKKKQGNIIKRAVSKVGSTLQTNDAENRKRKRKRVGETSKQRTVDKEGGFGQGSGNGHHKELILSVDSKLIEKAAQLISDLDVKRSEILQTTSPSQQKSLNLALQGIENDYQEAIEVYQGLQQALIHKPEDIKAHNAKAEKKLDAIKSRADKYFNNIETDADVGFNPNWGNGHSMPTTNMNSLPKNLAVTPPINVGSLYNSPQAQQFREDHKTAIINAINSLSSSGIPKESIDPTIIKSLPYLDNDQYQEVVLRVDRVHDINTRGYLLSKLKQLGELEVRELAGVYASLYNTAPPEVLREAEALLDRSQGRLNLVDSAIKGTQPLSNLSTIKLALLRTYQMAVIVKRQELEQLPSTSSGADQNTQKIKELKEEEVTMHDAINACIADSSKLNDVSFEEINEVLKKLSSEIPESAISDFESKAQKDPEAILDGSILQEMLSSKDSLPSGDEEQEDTEVTESGIQKAGDKGLLALPVSSNECALALSDGREKECLALGDGSEDEESYDSGFEEEEETIEQLSDSDGGNLKITEVDTAIPLEQKAKKEMQTQISENAPTLNQAKVVNTIVNNMIRNRLDASMNMSNNMVAVGAGDEEESRIKRGLWMRGMYGTNNHGRVENMTGYRGTNKGATIGFDVEIDNNILGIAYSNVHSVFKFKNSKNNDKELIDSHVVSIYGQKELPRNFALQALVSASKNFIKDKTTYSYGDTKIRSNVKHRNHSYNVEALLNYNYLLQNKLVITPNIGLRYGKSRDGVYNETGINVQEIALTMKENNILSGIVGTKVKVPLKDVLKFNNLGLTFQGAVEHNFKEKTQRINRVVKIFDTEFKQNYAIPKQPKTSYNLGTGIIGSIKNTTISLDYNYYLNKHYRSHQGSVKLKVNL